MRLSQTKIIVIILVSGLAISVLTGSRAGTVGFMWLALMFSILQILK